MGRHHPGNRRSRNPIPFSLCLLSRHLQPARIESDAALTVRLRVPQPAPRPTQPSAHDHIEAEGPAMTREELAALLDGRGQISAARSGRAGKRLVISLAPLFGGRGGRLRRLGARLPHPTIGQHRPR
jgi:hypothetical protein